MFIIQAIQTIAYICEKKLGNRYGLYVTSFFGGVLSSTASILNLIRRSSYSNIPSFYLVVSAILAIIGSFTLMIILLVWNQYELFSHIKFEIGAIILFLLLLILFFKMRHLGVKLTASEANNLAPEPTILNTLKLSLLVFGLISISKIAIHYFGHLGSKIVAVLGGVFEIHSIVMAQINMVNNGIITISDSVHHLILAMIASLLMKAVLAISSVRNTFTITLSLSLFFTSIITIIIYFLH